MLRKIKTQIEHFIPVIVVVIIIEFFPQYFNIDFLNPIQNSMDNFNLTDMVFSSIRDPHKVPRDTNIVIVNIGTLNRAGIARELEIINSYEPKVIGIDTFFKLRKNDTLDIPLITALSKVKNLVLAEKIVYNKRKQIFDSVITSHPDFTQFAVGGYANLPVDANDYMTVRDISPKEPVNGVLKYFFPLQIVKFFDSVKAKKLIDRDNKNEIVDFARNIDKYLVLDVKDVFKKRDSLDFIRGKIVLVGYLGPNIRTIVSEDNFYTPLNRLFLGKSFPDMYGLIIHANVISMILNESYFEQMPDRITKILEIILLSIIILTLHYLRVKRFDLYEPLSIISTLGLLLAVFAFLVFMFNKFNYYIGTSYMLWGIVLIVPVYEGYHDSIKPLTLNLISRIKNQYQKKSKNKNDQDGQKENPEC
jgi:CHASE2 domain-containing sensor protein